ncbi:MAG: DUF4249 family protein [Candidatus Latescibacterota bacterium]|nr:MAG: DUF4249 family protein [Candidatus Latescibacterota bacterium]
MMRWLAIIIFGLWAISGCSTDRPAEDFFAPSDIGTLVVDGLLIVDQPLPMILLSRATMPNTAYDPRVGAERDATITVYVHPDGPLVEYGETPGRGAYVPVTHDTLEVQPETTYELRVTTAKGETVRATTTTPERFAVSEWVLLDDEGANVQRRLRTYDELGEAVYGAPENQLVYTEGLLEGRFERGDGPGFHIGILSLDLTSDFVIDPEFFEEEDFDDLQREISSPAFEAPEGMVRLPWFTIFFEGRYKIRMYSVDENWYELILTLPEFGPGFGGEIGDYFERPSFNVEGGIGLFGSASVDSIGFFVHPRP